MPDITGRSLPSFDPADQVEPLSQCSIPSFLHLSPPPMPTPETRTAYVPLAGGRIVPGAWRDASPSRNASLESLTE